MKELLDWEESELSREEDRESGACTDEEFEAVDAKRDRLYASLKRELRWFYGALGGRVPDEGEIDAEARSRAITIDGHLKAIAAFHRGALALTYTPLAGSSVRRNLTRLEVRLDCVLHPSEGKTTAELEAESLERFDRGEYSYEVSTRADTHERLALAAYLKVRGKGPYLGRRGRPSREES
jgi:hypothetical protein